MLPATRPPHTMVFAVTVASPRILAHFAAKAAHSVGSLAVKAAIQLAAESCCCSKKMTRSSWVTSRSRMSLAGVLCTAFLQPRPPNTGDKLRSGAHQREALELRQLHPLVRRRPHAHLSSLPNRPADSNQVAAGIG